ncbi:NAD(P)-dependent oxidoreductase [Ferroplasma acidiphilum]|uniref:NAD(P)-dependent oxidoreductase n=1 Tax=Ferroplasma acidiphilum TaxID=74969 RepID=UPI0028156D85|nr:NAD(P)-dependent oxidoreductase [Ferroplasma acidiphilum]WMT53521.1 MAG: NAD(P)-dependent oxidoreductase [Ferroplasma acidiphilum]
MSTGSNKPVVVIEDSVISNNVKELKSMAEVITMSPYAGVDKWIIAVKDAVAVIDRKMRLSKEVLDAAPALKLIARTGIGVDETRIDLNEVRRRNIVVTYNPGINSDSVAELTVMLALSIYRKLFILNRYVREAKWAEGQSNLGNQIKGKAWGFIGFGNAGTHVANIVKSFGCSINAYDPYLNKQAIVERGGNPLELDALLRQCDIISIHVPLMDSTKHLIGERELNLMKKDAILINVSRGGIVDDTALYRALKGGKLRGAGLDTLEDEPIHVTNPLLTMDNVIITPHIGGSTHEAVIAGAELAVNEVVRLLKGEKPLSPYKL